MSEGSVDRQRKDRQRAVWETPECPFRIEYSAAMLNEIRKAAVEAYYSLPHGGVEIGGVLFGSIEPGRVVIRTFRRMECEHAAGPSFALSERDLESLERLLRESAHDSSLTGQQRVGWFHSHTRSEVCLTEADLDIHHGFFPSPQEVALVLRPLHLKPTRAGFFFRDESGEVQAEASYREFICDAAYLDTFTTDEPAPSAPEPGGPPPVFAVPLFASGPGPRGFASAPGAKAEPEPVDAPTLRNLGKWVAAAMVAATLSCAAVIALWRPHTVSSSAAGAPGVDFEAAELDGQTVLRWNRQSPAVQRASGGALDIIDGAEPKQITLQPDDVNRGMLLYRRTSPRAEFRLRLWQAGQPPLDQSATIEGAVPEPSAPAAKLRTRERRRR